MERVSSPVTVGVAMFCNNLGYSLEKEGALPTTQMVPRAAMVRYDAQETFCQPTRLTINERCAFVKHATLTE